MPLAIGATRGTISLPPVTSGLLLHIPFRKDALGVSMDVAKHWESPTMELTPATGSYKQRKTGLVTDSLANILRCERLGALFEDDRENLAIRAEEFDNGAWVQTNVTVVANDATAPDGNVTADRIDDNGAAAEVTQALAGAVLTNNLMYAFSVYVLEDDAVDFTLTLRDTGAAADRARGDFQWVAGALEVKSADVGTAGVEPIVAGWYRAWVVCPAAVIVGANAHGLRIYPTEDGGGAVGLGHWFWGAQCEEGAGPSSAPFPSSYTPTVAAAVIRTDDRLSYTNIGDVHCEPAAGTIILAVTPGASAATHLVDAYLYDITDGNDGVSLLISQANDTFQFDVDSGGGPVAAVQAPPGACRRGMTSVLATSWEANSFKLWMNGILVNQDTAGNAPTAMPNDIQVGQSGGATQGYSNIAYMITYDRVLTELEIRRLTEWIQQQLGVPDLPPVMEGLTFHAPMNQDETAMSFWKGYRETSEPTTQAVDSDGTYDQRTTGLVTGAITNKLRVERPGGLLEDQRENLLPRSQEINQAPWADTGTPIVTADTDVAPDGTTTADTIEDDSAVAQEGRRQVLVVPNDAVTRTFCVYIKKTVGATTFPGLQMRYRLGGALLEGYACLNTNTGVFTPLPANPPDDQGVEDAGDYWRVWMSLTNNASGNTNCWAVVYPAISVDGVNWANAPVGSAVFWGAQFEQAKFPSSYIPTVGAAVVRARDNLIYDNTNDVHAIPATGTVIIGFTPEWEATEHNHTYGALVDTRNAGNTDGVRLGIINATGLIAFEVRSGGASSVFGGLDSATAVSRGVPQVAAGTWAVNQFLIYMNGILENSDAAGLAPAAQHDIKVGRRAQALDFYAYSNEAHLCIYDRVLTQPEILAVSKWILEKLPAGSLPPVTRSLTLMAPMTPGVEATSFVGGAHEEAPSTETVDADGTFVDPTNYDELAGLSWVTDATLNELRRELHGGLIEGTRPNECLRSQEFDDAAWLVLGTPVVTANTDVGPDGTTTADTIEDDSNAAFEGVRQLVAVPNDALSRTFSGYIRKTMGAGAFPGFGLNYAGGAAVLGFVTVNTNAGTIVDRVGFAPDDSGVEDAGDYWRVWVVLANNAAGNTNCYCTIYAAVNADATGNWVAATLGSAVFWGAQLEQAAFPSSYIPTVGAGVVRVLDDYQFDNAAGQHMAAAAGTVFVATKPEFDAAPAGLTEWVFAALDAAPLNGPQFNVPPATTVLRFRSYSGGALTGQCSAVTPVARGVIQVAAVHWAVNNFKIFINGVEEGADAAGAAPGAILATITIGGTGGASDGHYNFSFLLTFTRVLDADEIDMVSHWIRRRLQAWM